MAVALPLHPLPLLFPLPHNSSNLASLLHILSVSGVAGEALSHRAVVSFADYCIYYQGRGKGVLLFHGYRVLVWENEKF